MAASLILLAVFISQHNKNEKAFIKNIKALEDMSEVVLNDVTPFEWEVVYSFGPYASKDKIQETIGFRANVGETVSEGMLHLLFVKDKEVVCEIIGYPSNLGVMMNLFGRIKIDDKVVFKVERKDSIVYLEEKTTDLTEGQIWQTIENNDRSISKMGNARKKLHYPFAYFLRYGFLYFI